MQSLELVEPTAKVLLPGSQSAHAVAPSPTAANLPTAHGVHISLPAALANVPASHCTQSEALVAPAALLVPAAQSVHAALLVPSLNFPGVQREQDAEGARKLHSTPTS
jgi:hypothetical protein